jgi:hypothetical protein
MRQRRFRVRPSAIERPTAIVEIIIASMINHILANPAPTAKVADNPIAKIFAGFPNALLVLTAI